MSRHSFALATTIQPMAVLRANDIQKARNGCTDTRALEFPLYASTHHQATNGISHEVKMRMGNKIAASS